MLSIKVSILSLLLSVSFLDAQSFFVNKIAPKISAIIPNEEGKKPGFGIGLVINFQEISGNINSYYYFTYEKPESSLKGFKYSNVQIGADFQYSFTKEIYAGVGISLNLLTSQINMEEVYDRQGGTVPLTRLKFGGSLIGGYNFKTMEFDSAIEGRYHFIEGYDHLEISYLFFLPL